MNTALLCKYILFLVEARRVELLSESILVTASPSAVCILMSGDTPLAGNVPNLFPLLHAYRQAYSFSSFIMRQLPQSFGNDVPR